MERKKRQFDDGHWFPLLYPEGEVVFLRKKSLLNNYFQITTAAFRKFLQVKHFVDSFIDYCCIHLTDYMNVYYISGARLDRIFS